MIFLITDVGKVDVDDPVVELFSLSFRPFINERMKEKGKRINNNLLLSLVVYLAIAIFLTLATVPAGAHLVPAYNMEVLPVRKH